MEHDYDDEEYKQLKEQVKALTLQMEQMVSISKNQTVVNTSSNGILLNDGKLSKLLQAFVSEKNNDMILKYTALNQTRKKLNVLFGKGLVRGYATTQKILHPERNVHNYLENDMSLLLAGIREYAELAKLKKDTAPKQYRGRGGKVRGRGRGAGKGSSRGRGRGKSDPKV